jgi:hypothetical protein
LAFEPLGSWQSFPGPRSLFKEAVSWQGKGGEKGRGKEGKWRIKVNHLWLSKKPLIFETVAYKYNRHTFNLL